MIYQHPDRQIPLTVILLKSDIMRGTMYLFLLLISTMCIFGAHADDNSITTSKDYVDSQVATLQDEIPAINSNTVLTHTGTSGEIGTKQIYDENADYASQQNSLVSAGTFNTAIQNVIDNEFVCIDWLGEHVPDNCLLWQIRPAYQKSQNLFDENTVVMDRYPTLNGLGISSKWLTSDYIEVAGLSQITISCISNYNGNAGRDFVFYDSNKIGLTYGTHILRESENLKISFTLNVPENAKYVRVGFIKTDINKQIEAGSTATPYVPYGNIYMPTSN